MIWDNFACTIWLECFKVYDFILYVLLQRVHFILLCVDFYVLPLGVKKRWWWWWLEEHNVIVFHVYVRNPLFVDFLTHSHMSTEAHRKGPRKLERQKMVSVLCCVQISTKQNCGNKTIHRMTWFLFYWGKSYQGKIDKEFLACLQDLILALLILT